MIKHRAQAGSLESSDLLVIVDKAEAGSGRQIDLNSAVALQFGDSIMEEVHRVLDRFNIQDVSVLIEDKGALQPTICARMETAILRSMDKQEGTMS